LIRKAKRSSAAHHIGSGSLGSGLGRRSAATRVASGDAGGSGATSHRRLPALFIGIALCLAAAALPAAASALTYAPGTPASFCTGTGVGAGECGELGGIAVDQSNGQILVVDRTNFRVDQFAPSGAFVRAFGADVVASGQHDNGTTNPEVCEPANSFPIDVCKVGVTTSSIKGAFGNPAKGIAVDPATHVVYVLTAAARVAYFNGDPTPISGNNSNFIGQTEGNAGEVNAGAPEKFANSNSVAVDTSNPAQHYLYVALSPATTGKIDKFAISQLGVTANSYVCQITGYAVAKSVTNTECGGNGVASHKDGAFEGVDSGSTTQTAGNLVVDGNGNVFLAERTAGSTAPPNELTTRQVVSEFDKNGNFVTQFRPIVNAHPSEPRPEALALFPNGRLLVADDGPVAPNGGSVVQEFDPASIPSAAPSAITSVSPISEFGSGLIGNASGGALGLATYGSDIFVADKPNKKVLKFSRFEAAAVTTEAASGMAKTTAILNGTVNPNGLAVSDCHFEYGLTTAYGSTAPCVPANPGSGTSPVAVSASISGLTQETSYHFRLVAANAAATTPGGDLTFTTTGLNKPTVTATPGATELTTTAAKVAGTVNPNGLEVTSCKVEYGTTPSFGSEAPCASISPNCSASPGSGTNPVGVCVPLTGLTPKTTYHFRFVASNEDGTTQSAEQTVTTLDAPTVVTGPASEVTQTTAKLAGSVNPNLSNVSDCHIEYGTTISYGSQKPCSPASVGAGSSAVPVSASLSGLTPKTTYHFRVVATNAIATTNGTDQSFETLPNPPTVVTAAGALENNQTTARVGGTVNPNLGNVSDCHVDYGATTSYGSQAPCAVLPGSGFGPVPVDATLTGLSPTTTYHFRVVATNAGGTTNGADKTLTTFGPPQIAEQSVSVLGGTSAILRGQINPAGFATDYYFEWGTDTAYGNRTPAEFDLFVGSGTAPVKVSGKLSGLQEGVTYHYRIVAASSAGTVQGPDQTFTTTANSDCPNAAIRVAQTSESNPAGTGYLPDCMALEMVTPPKKFNQRADTPNFSATGDSIEFFSLAALGETPQVGSVVGDPYVATRSASGWATHSLQPPIGELSSSRPCNFNLDLSKWFLGPRTAPLGLTPGTSAPYIGSLAGDLSSLGPILPPLNAPSGEGRRCEGGSADLSHVFYAVEKTAFLAGDPVASVSANENVYESYLDGEGVPTTELLARDKDGKVWGGTCGARIGWKEGNRSAFRGAISADASRVYFSTRPGQGAGNCNETINKRRVMKRLRTPAGPVITEVSASECTRVSPPCDTTNGDDNFRSASQEGGLVFFTTTRQLTNSDLDSGTACGAGGAGEGSTGCDLYLYDASRPAGARLTQVSAGEPSDPTPGKGAEVRGVPDISGDGSHAYFVAKGALTTTPNAQGASAQAGQPNLYLYERDAVHPAGRTAFIATLSPSDTNTWGDVLGGFGPDQNPAAAAPLLGADPGNPSLGGDGHVFVFRSNAALLPDDSDGGKSDLYRYDAPTGSLQRVSVAAPGGSDNGAFDVEFVKGGDETPFPQNLYFDRGISEDGDTIVFGTAEALDPADNDGAPTVYLWHDGNVTAIRGSASGAVGSSPSVSASGDVAFASGKSLLGQDDDGAKDVYVLRAGGGYPQPVPPVPCQGEGCQEPFTSQPPSEGAGSESFVGPGNLARPPQKCKKGFARKHGKCVKKRHPKKAAHKKTSKRHANANRGAGK
jgi:hypothetical protein